MRNQRTALEDRPPTVVCNHPDDVAGVTALPGCVIRVRFVDGTAGLLDLSDLIASPNAGVFSALRDESLFAQVGVVMGAVTWPNGLDPAPDAMHEALTHTTIWRVPA